MTRPMVFTNYLSHPVSMRVFIEKGKHKLKKLKVLNLTVNEKNKNKIVKK